MQRFFIVCVVLVSSVLFSGCSAGFKLFSQAVDRTAPKAEVVNTGPSFAPVDQKYIKPHGWVLVTQSGKTLYTYENDADYISNCTEECALIWQPFLISYLEAVGGAYEYIEKADGTMHVTLNGQPLYSYTPDTEGTANGDGKDGLWNVVILHND